MAGEDVHDYGPLSSVGKLLREGRVCQRALLVRSIPQHGDVLVAHVVLPPEEGANIFDVLLGLWYVGVRLFKSGFEIFDFIIYISNSILYGVNYLDSCIGQPLLAQKGYMTTLF